MRLACGFICELFLFANDVEELPLAQRPRLCKQVSKQSSSMVLFKSPAPGSCMISYPGFSQRLTGVTCEPPQVVLVVVCFVFVFFPSVEKQSEA